MNREQLRELGLTDEQIDSVMKEHGKTVNATKEQLDTVTTERDDLKVQLTERDEQLEELSKQAKGNDDLTAQIDELKQLNEQTKNDYEDKLNKQAFNHKLENTLSSAKVKNVKAVKALLDLDIVKLEEGELKGLNEQLESLKESDGYLFESEENNEPKPSFTTGQHQSSGNDNDPFAAKLAKYK